MLGNGRVVTIPKEQLALYKCDSCKNEVFKIVSGVTFVYDRLAPKGKGMQPQTATLYQCMSCDGYLRMLPDGSYTVIHPEKPGEEWTRGPG